MRTPLVAAELMIVSPDSTGRARRVHQRRRWLPRLLPHHLLGGARWSRAVMSVCRRKQTRRGRGWATGCAPTCASSDNGSAAAAAG
eukprot:scaffold92418_cov32-Tisochrysis_lutea.AAC.1